ncbi:MAG: AAA family ATPase [Deltaproteobacteria bacterium]|nr:AAA family ATPase [Deltaproteobacteria bacterium]
MYLAYFGLQEPPFRITPDTKFLFLTQQYESALDSLAYAIQERMGFLVLTGEVGTGKTLLTRQLLARLEPDVASALLVNPLLSVPELLTAINRDFGLAVRVYSPQRLIESLNKFLLTLQKSGRTALVVVDESQNLSIEALEMVRMLSNLETENAKLLQILLVGQPELERKLMSHELRQLRQRIGVHVRLEPLPFLQMVRYITHRITLAGGQGRVYFEPGAYRSIYRLTHGYPRLINVLCDRALTAAYTLDTPILTKRVVRHAYYDLRPRRPLAPVWQFWRRQVVNLGF